MVTETDLDEVRPQRLLARPAGRRVPQQSQTTLVRWVGLAAGLSERESQRRNMSVLGFDLPVSCLITLVSSPAQGSAEQDELLSEPPVAVALRFGAQEMDTWDHSDPQRLEDFKRRLRDDLARVLGVPRERLSVVSATAREGVGVKTSLVIFPLWMLPTEERTEDTRVASVLATTLTEMVRDETSKLRRAWPFLAREVYVARGRSDESEVDDESSDPDEEFERYERPHDPDHFSRLVSDDAGGMGEARGLEARGLEARFQLESLGGSARSLQRKQSTVLSRAAGIDHALRIGEPLPPTVEGASVLDSAAQQTVLQPGKSPLLSPPLTRREAYRLRRRRPASDGTHNDSRQASDPNPARERLAWCSRDPDTGHRLRYRECRIEYGQKPQKVENTDSLLHGAALYSICRQNLAQNKPSATVLAKLGIQEQDDVPAPTGASGDVVPLWSSILDNISLEQSFKTLDRCFDAWACLVAGLHGEDGDVAEDSTLFGGNFTRVEGQRHPNGHVGAGEAGGGVAAQRGRPFRSPLPPVLKRMVEETVHHRQRVLIREASQPAQTL